jgi:predicted glycosyltransferase
MRYLFYLVHPAKFQVHKTQINTLRERGHSVDVIINSKDILEELLKEEKWEYTNLFPKSRKIKGVHVYIAAFISIFRTLWKLFKYTQGKKYDLFIGDLLTVLGRIKRTPSLYHTDDVIVQVPEQSIFLFTCNHILSPQITELGYFNKKKIKYDGYKALLYLHPEIFSPSKEKISERYRNCRFFMIRCTGFGATHDVGRKGIDNDVLERVVELLRNKGEIIISSERELPERFKKYEYSGKKNDIYHYMAFADIFIGDSVTMCTEAALLGVPVVEYDDYWFEMEQMLELKYKYEIINLFKPPHYEIMLHKIDEIINNSKYKDLITKRRDNLIHEKIDVNGFFIWFMENYPQSYKEYIKLPFIQYQFH